MTLMDVIHFALGDIFSAPLGPAMATLGFIMLIALIYETFSSRNRKEGAAGVLRRVIAYLVFLIVAHRLDELAVDRMFDWKGSTQYIITLGLCVTEGLPLLRRIGQWADVTPPDVLTRRLSQMEQGNISAEYIDGRELDLKIQNLRENMEKLKEYERLKREAQNISTAAALTTELTATPEPTETPPSNTPTI